MKAKQKKVTLQDIADLVGVSRVHVARALYSRGYVEDALKEKILKTATDLNYVADRAATALVSGRPMNIAMYIDTDFNYYNILSPMLNIIKKISDRLVKHGYSLQILTDPELQGNIRTDGMIIPYGTEKIFRSIIKNIHVPVVTFSKTEKARMAFFEKHSIPYVVYDTSTGLSEFAETVRKKSILKACILDFTSEMQDLSDITVAFKNHGIKIGHEDIIKIPRETERITSHILKALPLLKKYGICILRSEILASFFYQAVSIAGLQIPEDIAVAGYDNAYYTQSFSPSLSSLYFSLDELSEKTVSLLLDSINKNTKESSHIIDTRFIDRGSL